MWDVIFYTLSSADFYASMSIFITGYAGYIPSVSSENVYGCTYSKATQSSAEATIHKGMDQPPSIKYRSTANAEFQQRHADQFESVS